MSRLQTRLITEFDEFRGCRQRWNELAGDRVFHRWEWMFSWWEQYCSGGELAIVVFEDDRGHWVGIAPWYKSTSPARGRVIQTLASGSACSDYVSLAIRPGFTAPVIVALGRLMLGRDVHELFADVDLFEIEGHLATDPAIQLLHEAAACRNASVVMHEIGGTWRSALPADWHEYEATLHRSFRRKTRKAEKRLANAEFSGEVFLTPKQLQRAWPIFADLHQMRRQSLGQPGCFADPHFERFLQTASLRLAESAHSQINLVHYKGRPITANLEFIAGDSVFMYQTGMDPEYLSLEPGHINFTWAIQASIERGFRWFDFLRGDEVYKSRWKATRAPLWRTRIVPDRWMPRVRSSLWNAGRQFRDWTQTMTGRSSH